MIAIAGTPRAFSLCGTCPVHLGQTTQTLRTHLTGSGRRVGGTQGTVWCQVKAAAGGATGWVPRVALQGGSGAQRPSGEGAAASADAVSEAAAVDLGAAGCE